MSYPLVEYKSAIEDYKNQSYCANAGHEEHFMAVDNADVKKRIKVLIKLKENNAISEATFNRFTKALLGIYLDEMLAHKMQQLNSTLCNSFYRSFNKSNLLSK